MIELLRALAALADPPAIGHGRLTELLGLPDPPEPADHAELFLFQLPPFASIYLGAEGKLGGEARDRVAGFWRAVGQSPPDEPDHITALLGFYAQLSEAEAAEADEARAALLGRGAAALLHEHILPWMGPYLSCVRQIGAPFYAEWAELLLETLEEEHRRRGVAEALPLHLRAAPPLPDPRTAGGDAFLEGILAPVRSGMILTRADLAQGAARVGVAVRAGERRYALAAMMSQDAGGILGWLATQARDWQERHTASVPVIGEGVAEDWSARARRAAGLLDALSDAAREATPCPK